MDDERFFIDLEDFDTKPGSSHVFSNLRGQAVIMHYV